MIFKPPEEWSTHICPYCNHGNNTRGDIGAAICLACGKGYHTKRILKWTDILNLKENEKNTDRL